ncbi:MAG TPA: hypothetical protein DDW52_24545 [Planctomycetaceae bacterium]|nr:hypothetical protein [Planctomycetaceae bacterium]
MASESRSKPQLPTKWLVAIIACLIIYAFVQPTLNSRFGWGLPSVASLLGHGDEGNLDSLDSQRADNSGVDDSQQGSSREGERAAQSQQEQSGVSRTDTAASVSDPASEPGESRAPPNLKSAGERLRYGLLRSLGAERYQSPAGLQYVPMSGPEKHRLEHIGKHLKDVPSRPAHGVFDGDMPQVLRWLDEAYVLIKDGDKRAYQKESGRRDVYDVRFDKTVGYLGGQAGKRKNNPDAYKIRIVLEGNRVITAFPVD